jgi:3-oxoacyl-[acyl-carrier protein] reductase
MIDCTGQVVLITGGSRGIGRATAFLFSESGATVLITYAGNITAAKTAVLMMKKEGQQAEAFRLRVENRSECRKLVGRIMKKYGRIDVLVNNAGIWEEGAVDAISEREWRKTVEVNLDGTFNMCSAVVPFMKKQKIRTDRQYCEHSRSEGRGIPFTLCSIEGRSHRFHKITRVGIDW